MSTQQVSTVLTWNVNGLRAILDKGFEESILEEYKPDLICLQEIKCKEDQINWQPKGYKLFWNPAERPGYSGTLTLSRIDPLSVKKGWHLEEGDPEGRILTLEFEDFFLVNVYTPNAKRDLSRLTFRHQNWDPTFCDYLNHLNQKKDVLFCGDLNVAHQAIDLANPKSNTKNAGFTEEERSGFTRYIESGYLDLFREFNAQPQQYTWWSYRTNARARNIGWRIDYFCSSKGFRPFVKDCKILNQIYGSDHCPVLLEIKSKP